jgi:TFIIF-interacting CTD phosphatase-like protein
VTRKQDHEKYILVLDLDETLVHFKESIKFNISDYDKLKVRPGVQQFLESLEPFYKFVVFTAAQKMYADFAIKKIDPLNKYFIARFYRDSCK